MDSEIYLKKLLRLRYNVSIKIITGFRGTGKTTLLKNFVEHLILDGTLKEQILFMDFENEEYLMSVEELYSYVAAKTENFGHSYIIFDEVQKFEGWEKVVNALFLGSDADIYIAGSDGSMLVQKISKLLPDHYDLVNLCPLSFSEYSRALSENVSETYKLNRYLKMGGLPCAANISTDEKLVKKFLRGLCYESLFQDAAVDRSVKLADIFLGVAKFLSSNIGRLMRNHEVLEYVEKINSAATKSIVKEYLLIAEEIGLFKKIQRYDLKKEYAIQMSNYFYCTDNGICNALWNFNYFDEAAMLKNTVCNELFRRGYEIYSPKFGEVSADFLAISENERIIVHVLTGDKILSAQSTVRSLSRFPAEIDKFLISTEKVKTNDSVINLTLTDFLLNR